MGTERDMMNWVQAQPLPDSQSFPSLSPPSSIKSIVRETTDEMRGRESVMDQHLIQGEYL